jgi:DNA (cytosine-5)-methyltransferase 1
MRPWSRYDELTGGLIELGYNISEVVLDASDFGVAQKRRRLFVVCDRDKPVRQMKTPRRKTRTVEDILDEPGIWKTTPLYSPKRAKPTLERAERGFAALGKRASFLLVYYGTDGCGGWQTLDRPLRTVTTVDRFALVEPNRSGHEIRMLQVSELRRAMGFRSDFQMSHGSRREKIRILGNGVCPPVMQAIIEHLQG